MTIRTYFAKRIQNWSERRAARAMDAQLAAIDRRLGKLPQAQRRKAFDSMMQALSLRDGDLADATDRMAALARKHGLSPWMTKTHR